MPSPDGKGKRLLISGRIAGGIRKNRLWAFDFDRITVSWGLPGCWWVWYEKNNDFAIMTVVVE